MVINFTSVEFEELCFSISEFSCADERASVVHVYNEKVSDWATFDHDALKNTSFSFRILSPVPMNDTAPRPPPICVNVTTTNGSWIGDNCSSCLKDSNCRSWF